MTNKALVKQNAMESAKNINAIIFQGGIPNTVFYQKSSFPTFVEFKEWEWGVGGGADKRTHKHTNTWTLHILSEHKIDTKHIVLVSITFFLGF